MSSKKRKNKSHFEQSVSTVNQQPAKKEWKNLIRAGLLFAFLLSVTVAFGAFVQWRNTAANNEIASKINANETMPVLPTTTPQYEANQPAREYVYGGGKLIAVSEPVRPAPNDLAIWRISSGTWWVLNGDGTYTTQQWGQNGDIPAPGDYDGDGKTDFCVFRPTEGVWYVMPTTTNTMAVHYYGVSGDKPVPADFDGDGQTDLALYRSNNQTWYVRKLASNTDVVLQFGISGDVPIPSDYDGDGKADFALWRNSNATWQIWQSSNNSAASLQWGVSGDKPVPGDFDGDGKTDAAIWRNDNQWYIRQSSNGSWMIVSWGYQASDISVQGDYDSDGKTDIAVWRPSDGTWYIRKSSTGTLRAQQWGQNGDTPVPAPYRRSN